MSDNTEKTVIRSQSVGLRSGNFPNGSVHNISTGTMVFLRDGPPLSVRTESADLCEFKPKSGAILNVTHDNKALLQSAAHSEPSTVFAHLRPSGNTRNVVEDSAGNRGITDNSSAAQTIPYNPVAQVVDWMSKPRGSSGLENSSTSLAVAGRAMAENGITCVDANGAPSVPVLTPNDLRTMVSAAISQPRESGR